MVTSLGLKKEEARTDNGTVNLERNQTRSEATPGIPEVPCPKCGRPAEVYDPARFWDRLMYLINAQHPVYCVHCGKWAYTFNVSRINQVFVPIEHEPDETESTKDRLLAEESARDEPPEVESLDAEEPVLDEVAPIQKEMPATELEAEQAPEVESLKLRAGSDPNGLLEAIYSEPAEVKEESPPVTHSIPEQVTDEAEPQPPQEELARAQPETTRRENLLKELAQNAPKTPQPSDGLSFQEIKEKLRLEEERRNRKR